ncbi:MAG TPA: cupredoxin domain-containing protein [Rhizomicrobium sp.]|jgi:plastocyanin|nr:cupredoxin domain-containing protein [Rhizomicrobium sp.]
MKFRSQILASAIGLTIGLSGLAGAAHAAETVVDQMGLKFVPNTVTINAGDTIRFTNSDPFTHDVTVVSPDGSTSDKGLQHHGKENAVVFAKPGTYSIICKMHPNMKATVIVK